MMDASRAVFPLFGWWLLPLFLCDFWEARSLLGTVSHRSFVTKVDCWVFMVHNALMVVPSLSVLSFFFTLPPSTPFRFSCRPKGHLIVRKWNSHAVNDPFPRHDPYL